MNVSPIRQLLLVAQTAAQEQKLLACSVALKEIERDAARNNIRPARGLIRALSRAFPPQKKIRRCTRASPCCPLRRDTESPSHFRRRSKRISKKTSRRAAHP
jgi:hypothetical protein